MTGALPLMKVSDYLSFLAETILGHVLAVAWHYLVERHGTPQKADGVPCDPDFIVVAYGKLGGIELAHGSDLDLVFIHDADPMLATDGERAIENGVFFTRLGQRIIHVLTAYTPLGQLYEVDMRLRPSGAAGLLVSSLTAFREYQYRQAWTWEHQALVRARGVAGDGALLDAFDGVREQTLTQPRDAEKLRQDVDSMRLRMRAELDRSDADRRLAGRGLRFPRSCDLSRQLADAGPRARRMGPGGARRGGGAPLRIVLREEQP